MRHYFYHGFEPISGEASMAVKFMLHIIESGGIKKRSEIRGGEELNHICLYRKNEEFNYSNNTIYRSARGGWIDNCMVFVISDDIKAEYVPPNVKIEGLGLPTDLVDEWRCLENIPVSKIVGIAIPLTYFKKVLEGEDSFSDAEEVQRLRESLKELKDICNQIGWKVYNSEEQDFTDKLDAELQKEKTTEFKSIQDDEEIK